MSKNDILKNIGALIQNTGNGATNFASSSYLSQNLEEAIKYDIFFDINYEQYGERILRSSRVPDERKEEIRQLWSNKKSQDTIMNSTNTMNENTQSKQIQHENNTIKDMTIPLSSNIFTSNSNEIQLHDLFKKLANLAIEITKIKQEYSAKIDDMDRIIKSHERDSSFLTSQITKLTKKNNELEDIGCPVGGVASQDLINK